MHMRNVLKLILYYLYFSTIQLIQFFIYSYLPEEVRQEPPKNKAYGRRRGWFDWAYLFGFNNTETQPQT